MSPSRSFSSQTIDCPVETSSAWVIKEVSGSHQFKITRYSHAAKLVGDGKYIESAIFYVGGHAWTIRCYPPKFTYASKPYVGLHVALASDATNVRALYSFSLLKENEDLVLRASTDLVTFAYKGQYNGCSYSMSDKSRFIIDDCLTVRCTVTVLKGEPHVVESMIPSITAPPSDLHQHLEQLLESREGADVTFKVGGTIFAAHRCVLAARSPVFKAQLFGGMKVKNTRCIRIKEMDDAVFKALLHFIYSESVPPEIEESQSSLSTLMAQHLLSAADRYDLKKLKIICEEKLCQNMDVDTVATTLALAEQHSCDRLKAACLEFIDSPGKLIAIVLTDGFDHLKKSCPTVLTELLIKYGFLSTKIAVFCNHFVKGLFSIIALLSFCYVIRCSGGRSFCSCPRLFACYMPIHSRNICFYRRHGMTEDSFIFSHSSFKTDGQPNLRCSNPSVCIIPTRLSLFAYDPLIRGVC